MVSARNETPAHQPDDRFSIMPVANRKKKMCPELKVILLGDAGVGKTSLLAELTKPTTTLAATAVGVDYRVKIATLHDQITKLQLWDTANQEKFGASVLPRSYFRGARGAVLVYDATDRHSFYGAVQWAMQLQAAQNGSEPLGLVLVANSKNVTSSRLPQVPPSHGQALAQMLQARFVEYASVQDTAFCFDALVQELSRMATAWTPSDANDTLSHLKAIEASEQKPAEQPGVCYVSETETESESESEDSEDLQTYQPSTTTTILVPEPVATLSSGSTTIPITKPQRRNSRLYAALEFGFSASSGTFMATRELRFALLFGGCTLLCMASMVLLLVHTQQEYHGLTRASHVAQSLVSELVHRTSTLWFFS